MHLLSQLVAQLPDNEIFDSASPHSRQIEHSPCQCVRSSHSSTSAPQHLSTQHPAPSTSSTQAPQHLSTSAPQHLSTSAPQHPSTLYACPHRLPLVQHQNTAGIHPHHRRGRRGRQQERCQGRHRARLGDAHHVRRVRQRLGGWTDPRLPDLARETRAGGPQLSASSDRRGQRRRAPQTDDHGPSGRLPITDGKLDLGPWEQVFYAEFDGMRKKRVVVKVMGIARPEA